jgi:hypothetical protein
MIQLLKFCKGELVLPELYRKICFRNGVYHNKPIEYDPKYKDIVEKSDLFVVEVCSRKKYVHNGYYLNYTALITTPPDCTMNTPPEIHTETQATNETDEEIEKDLLEIREMIAPRPLLVVSHFNALVDEKVIPSRDLLIQSLTHICEKHKIPFVNPTLVFSNYNQNDILDGFNHYSQKGRRIITNYLNSKIDELLKLTTLSG